MIAVDLEIWKENREFKTDPKKSEDLPEIKEIKQKNPLHDDGILENQDYHVPTW